MTEDIPDFIADAPTGCPACGEDFLYSVALKDVDSTETFTDLCLFRGSLYSHERDAEIETYPESQLCPLERCDEGMITPLGDDTRWTCVECGTVFLREGTELVRHRG